VNDLVAGRHGHRADLVDDGRDASPAEVASPDRIADAQGLDRDLAVRRRDHRAPGQTDRAGRRAAGLLVVDVDRPVGPDRAGNMGDDRSCTRVRPGPAEPRIEAPASGGGCQRECAEHLPVAVGGEESVAGWRCGWVEPDVSRDRGPGGRVGLHLRTVFGRGTRLVDTGDGIEVGVAVNELSEVDQQRDLRCRLGQRASAG
jgi:hypothetical protein